MSVNFNSERRRFLRGQIAPRPNEVRPPWSSSEWAFIERCTRCDRCTSACPEQIIRKGDGGYPSLDFSLGECTFCRDCVAACPTDALMLTEAPPWQLEVTIDSHCVTHKQVVCRSCAEQCEPQAIRLQPLLGRVAEPQIDLDRCSGCGACVAVCPADAISITPISTTPISTTPISTTPVNHEALNR